MQMLCQSVDEYNSTGVDDGEATDLQAIIRALFKEDRRLNEAQDILSTHKARVIRLDQQPGSTESEYLEHQKEVVSRIATSTLAIPAGRGLLYHSLRFPLLTQKFHIGGFNLNCVVRPANQTVGVDKAQFTEDKVCWGFFHQGVSAGLSISPHARGIDNSWILYNKPGQDLSNRHAGFLLALGLNGHLRGVAKWVAFKYLTPRHTMTSIGLLLGLAASYMGTMDSLITRLLSVHVTRMLPRGAAELNLSPLTQTSGIMGIGLLYCGSQHRRMSEVMMSEIQHIDEEDEEEPLRSEGYRLAAGFALGFINLGKGAEQRGLHDVKLAEKLVAIATATKKVEVTHVLDRAAAGAVVAVALMYMKSEDAMIARKIDVPDSVVQFDYVRPDVLMLRALAKNLILWSRIQPTGEWVRESLPRELRSLLPLSNYTRLTSKSLPFFAILAGTAFAVGLRFAGSADVRARDLLIELLDELLRIARLGGGEVYDEELARAYVRSAQDVVAVSCAMVMAGTGDLLLLRRIRSLHGHAEDAPYGSHLAAHLAAGALFLSCGTATFSIRDEAVASLLVAFYPIWPGAVGDNKAHLQAFRHFWVLAVDERCLVTRDMATGQPASVRVRIEMRDGGVLEKTTPCLLPPVEDVLRVVSDAGPTYWDVTLDFSSEGEGNSSQSKGGRKGERKGKMRVAYLQRRPPMSSPFSAMEGRAGPIRWIFEVAGLRHLAPSDRAGVMDTG
ncbi:hypothetical protein IMZ48_36685, partial [Candidatus Bathyarchaeota archaeon]|nr:hypothetical protein [Candidatus Bathyarchaeota archaeon]